MMLARRSLGLACVASLPIHGELTRQTLKIGVEDRWPPYAYGRQGQAQGRCVEIARAALKVADIPHQFEVMPYRRCVHLTQHGALDACLTVPRKRALQATLAFGRVPLLHVTGLVFTRKGGAHDQVLRDVTDMEGRRLAVALGFDYGGAIDDNPRITKLSTVNPENVFQLVLLDRADYAIYEASRAMELFRQRPGLRTQLTVVGSLEPQAVYMAFSRKLDRLDRYLRAFDDALGRPSAAAITQQAPAAAQSAPISLSKRSALSTYRICHCM